MMNYGTRGREKSHAEVFTPAGLVFFMIMQEGIRPMLKDVGKTILGPSVGQGQFPCAELVMKLFYNIDALNENKALRALESLHGVDIQASSCAQAREHLIQTLCDSYRYFTDKDFTRLAEARTIVDENIICGNFLELAEQWLNPQLSLF